jgi:formamidopyrimidine-DNA glycosylase
MDQRRLAGVGNLAADEALWRAGLSPHRPANSLDERELRRLQRHLRQTMEDLLTRGGSHTGDLMPERVAEGVCPKDGTPLVHDYVGGRSTWWCPVHQT